MVETNEGVPKLNDEELVSKLAEVLQDWPLYRAFVYTGSAYGFVPEEISLFCGNTKCQKEQQWFAKIYTGEQKSGWNGKEYTCKNCGKNVTRYYFFWTNYNDGTSRFFKVGQYPPLQKEPPLRLSKKLSAVDHDLYRKALTSRNNSYGLGALSYLRRVVENRMNDLLDLLYEAAKDDEAATDELKKIEDV